MIKTITSSRAGRLPLSELPEIAAYDVGDLEKARSWPAIDRYLNLIERKVSAPGEELRRDRHIEWLKCALATFHDRVPASDVCRHWSRAAEGLIARAWHASGCERPGLALLALGKLGAEELNLSSDVDLIVVRADDETPDMRAFREFQALLADNTDFGYVLRLDFTLRPGGRASAAIPSASEFINHYGYHGEMWERLAYVRMRILGSASTLADEITTFSRKFSYRKHLDYTLLEELKSLRAKIRSEKFDARAEIFHLKLGIGGIRELELFVHALQILHGGRNPRLQTHSTTQALNTLRDLALLPADECEFLRESYWYLRTLENRLQAFEDQQTYNLDMAKAHPSHIAGFAPKLRETTARIATIGSSLFSAESANEELPADASTQDAWLVERGYSKSSREDTWPALLTATALSRRSEADERARLAFLRGFVNKLSDIGLDRDLGLSLLLDFVRAVRAKASFFTLLNRETRVRDELAMLFSISPYLGTILASRPELIDEFIFRKQAEPSDDFNLLLEGLAERRLLAELIAANRFLADRNLRAMTVNLSSNADEISSTLLERLKLDLGASDLGLVPLGKWGGRELGLRSDLDFIFITKSPSNPETQKIAKRFLSRITEPHRGGAIYSVDMRLRPSGNAGPIMVAEHELESYLHERAAAWERQAYLRARPLTQLDFSPAQAAAKRGLSPEDRAELRSIRSRLFVAADPSGTIDLKLAYGGLADVEFTAQIALLERREFSLDPSTCGMIQYLEGVDRDWNRVGPAIREGYESLRRIEQLFQLTTRQTGSKLKARSEEFARLALILDSSPADLEERLRSEFNSISSALKEVRDLDRSSQT